MPLMRKAEIDAYWREYHELDSAEEVGPACLLSCGEDEHDRLVTMHRRNDLLAVICAPSQSSSVRAALLRCNVSLQTNPEEFAHALGVSVDSIRRPEELWYVDTNAFAGHEAAHVRELTPADREAFSAAQQACNAADRTLGEIGWDDPCIVGAFVGDEIAALASYRMYSPVIADIGVLTHPAYRGGGHGRAASSMLTSITLERELIPQWWSLSENTGSLRIAQALGYQHYATEQYLVLPDEDHTGM